MRYRFGDYSSFVGLARYYPVGDIVERIMTNIDGRGVQFRNIEFTHVYRTEPDQHLYRFYIFCDKENTHLVPCAAYVDALARPMFFCIGKQNHGIRPMFSTIHNLDIYNGFYLPNVDKIDNIIQRVDRFR